MFPKCLPGIRTGVFCLDIGSFEITSNGQSQSASNGESNGQIRLMGKNVSNECFKMARWFCCCSFLNIEGRQTNVFKRFQDGAKRFGQIIIQ